MYWSGLDMARESPELWVRLMKLMMTSGEPFPEIGISLKDERNSDSRQNVLRKGLPCEIEHVECEDCEDPSVGVRLGRYPKCMDHYGWPESFDAYKCSHGDLFRSF